MPRPGSNNPTPSSHSTSSTADYVRQARRLRGRYARQPQKLASELQKLAKAVDDSPAPKGAPSVTVRVTRASAVRAYSPSLPGVLKISPVVSAQFADEVAAAMNGGTLRFTARQRLLARAERMGIGRFEANLLIASVLHAQGKSTITPPADRTAAMLLWFIATVAAVLAIAAMW